MSPEPSPLSSGQRILHFTLVEKLGEGGMGVVWKAIDSTLDRPVALKVLPPAFAADAERMARFEREAKMLASLNHANIATVYSVHVVDGVRYLSMELVPGEDLAQRLARGPVPVPEALEIAKQIALALEAAHESGVVHRDLKPANVRITPDGRVKVLDFGLAKALDAGPGSSTMSQSPTFAVSAMTTGMIIGTAAYMAPEQARGQSVDRRADIWAFGVVLYEMLTARRAFDGETVSDTLAAVLRAEPDRDALPADLPRPIRTLIGRCLEKTPRRRLRDIGEAVLTIEDVLSGRSASEPAAAAAPPRRADSRTAMLVGALVAALVAAGAGAMLNRQPSAPLRKFTLSLDEHPTIVTETALSPNGRQLAYVREGRLMLRDLGQTTSRVLADGLSESLRPAWSPNSESIVFATTTDLKRVDVSSGAISPLCTVGDFTGGSGATWMGDGNIVFARGHDHLYRVAEAGGASEIYLARVDSLEGDLHHPYALPGGRGVLFVRHMSPGGPRILSLYAGGKRRDLLDLPNGFIWEPVYDPRGYIVFARVGDTPGIWAMPFSLKRLAVTGPPRMIAPDGSSPSISNDGTLVYRLGASLDLHSTLVTLTRSGQVRDTLAPAVDILWSLALSPDDHRLALDVRPSGDADIWVEDLIRRSQTRFAFGPGRQLSPAWSPDGREIYFRDDLQSALVVQPADGSRAPRRIFNGMWPHATPDGTHLLCSRESPGTNGPDIWYVTVDGRDSMALVVSPGVQEFPVAAPQGGYFLYQSDESGTTEIYLRPYPTGDARWQVSLHGGILPQWSARGDHIYYLSAHRFYEVDVSLEPTVRLGTPRELFDIEKLGLQSTGRFLLVPTRDPDRFIAALTLHSTAASRIDGVVVENWPAEFAKKR